MVIGGLKSYCSRPRGKLAELAIVAISFDLAALEAVGLLGVVARWKNGLDTKLTEGGRPLTSTQVNLLLIARALAAAPALLLVDGLLDDLSDDELDPTLDLLLAPERDWTVVVATGRQRVASKFDSLVQLPSGGFDTEPINSVRGATR